MSRFPAPRGRRPAGRRARRGRSRARARAPRRRRRRRVISTAPAARRAWPRTAPRGRCTRPTTARSTSSSAARTTPPGTSACSSPGGYADAAAQDAFCADTRCVISVIYDQSPKGNDLKQAPPGTFKGPAPGQFNELPIADMAPTTINGHRAYGAYIIPGMGYRNNQATGIAVDDEAEGIYMVFDGTHYDSGCCFDYGNAQRSSTAEGVGTMETVYFGTATAWARGTGPGPWLMSDMEAGLYASNLPNGTSSPNSPTITDRFVSGFVGGDTGNHFSIRKGNAPDRRPGHLPRRRPPARLLADAQEGRDPARHRRRQRQRVRGHVLRGRDDVGLSVQRDHRRGAGQHRGGQVQPGAGDAGDAEDVHGRARPRRSRRRSPTTRARRSPTSTWPRRCRPASPSRARRRPRPWRPVRASPPACARAPGRRPPPAT